MSSAMAWRRRADRGRDSHSPGRTKRCQRTLAQRLVDKPAATTRCARPQCTELICEAAQVWQFNPLFACYRGKSFVCMRSADS